jgi:D-threonate/D-erythronate kinase
MSDFFLADDLSGALDAAAGFHHAGEEVTIVWTPEAWRKVNRGVVGITTETRNAAPEVAAAIVAETIAQGRQLGHRLVYKKIDSTLRGPVAAELGALVQQIPDARILFAPANPAVGRTIRDGVLLVHGVPVAETEFGRDPLSPVKESVIRRLLGEAVAARASIPDILNETDLENAVAQMSVADKPWIAVGSGALARPVAARRPKGERSSAIAAEPPPGPTLMICGSAHPRNREQAARLEREQGVAQIEFRPSQSAQAITAVVSALRRGNGAALIVEQQRGDSGRMVREMAGATAEIVRHAAVRRMFITGGETAFAVCGELGVSSLRFLREIEAGLSLSRGETANRTVLHLAIKPGGFGDTQTWERAWQALRG